MWSGLIVDVYDLDRSNILDHEEALKGVIVVPLYVLKGNMLSDHGDAYSSSVDNLFHLYDSN